MADTLATNVTNPEAKPGDNPSLSPAQNGDTGNPVPKAPEARAPVKEEPKKEEPKADDTKADDKATEPVDENKPLDMSVWGDTGTENGNAVLEVLQNSGLTTDEAQALIGGAFLKGDVTAIDRAALEAKVGKAKATIIITGVKNEIADRTAAANAIVAEIHTVVGGKDNWDKVATWANKSVPDADLKEYRSMIDAGGKQAKLAAAELKALYEKADGNSSLVVSETLPGPKPPTPTSEPLSGPQYVRKLEELNKKFFGNPPDNLRQALLSARQEGRKRGL